MEDEYLTDIQKAPFLYLSAHPKDFHTPMTKALKKGRTVDPCDMNIFRHLFLF